MTDQPDALPWACEIVMASRVLTDDQKRLWCAYAQFTQHGEGVVDHPQADAIFADALGMTPERVRVVRAELEALGLMGREAGETQ